MLYLHGGDYKNGDRNRIDWCETVFASFSYTNSNVFVTKCTPDKDGAFLASKQRFVVVTVNYR